MYSSKHPAPLCAEGITYQFTGGTESDFHLIFVYLSEVVTYFVQIKYNSAHLDVVLEFFAKCLLCSYTVVFCNIYP